jgi:hypothetical protein
MCLAFYHATSNLIYTAKDIYRIYTDIDSRFLRGLGAGPLGWVNKILQDNSPWYYFSRLPFLVSLQQLTNGIQRIQLFIIMKITQYQPFSLRAVVEELIACYGKSGNSSLQIINNISSELVLIKHIDSLAPLIGDLLSIVSSTNSNQPVFISAMKINGGYKLYAVGEKLPASKATTNHLVKNYKLMAN